MKVVVTHWIHASVRSYLSSYATVIGPSDHEQGVVWSRSHTLEEASDADALITSMADLIDASFLSFCPRLKIIAATLKGYDNYDATACTQHGVWLAIVPDSIIPPTAELGLSLTLDVLRNVSRGDRVVRSGAFEGWRPQLYGRSLAGATVGMLGFGALGRAVAKFLSAFDIAALLYIDQDERRSPEGERVSLEALFERSDVVIVSLPLTSETHHLVNSAVLSRLRKGSYVVNIGRGSVVDEHAILEALQKGVLAGYAADVFEMEDWALATRPREILEELRTHPNTVFTPHLGSAVDEVREKMSLNAAKQIYQALHGQRPEHAVNDPAGIQRS